MPSLKDLRNRIASVKATQKITKAMQMVAAAKLRRAQTAAEAARPPEGVAWTYPWGVTLYGVMRSTDATGDKEMLDWALEQAALAAVNVFLASVLFSVGYFVTGSLWLPIAAHAAYNMFVASANYMNTFG